MTRLLTTNKLLRACGACTSTTQRSGHSRGRGSSQGASRKSTTIQARFKQLRACARRYRDQRDRPDLTNPESLQLYLETRFEQLKVCWALEAHRFATRPATRVRLE